MLILIITEKIKDYSGEWVYFVSGFLMSLIIYWYLLSSFLHFYYGNFLSISGIYYILSTRTLFMRLIIGLIFLGIGFFSGFLIYIYARQDRNKLKISLWWIAVFIAVLIIIALIIPKNYAAEISPLVDFVKTRSEFPDIINPPEEVIHKRVLDLDINLKKPNIIFITLESVSAEHIHYWGYERNITPNIDKLAGEGIVFKNAYTTATHTDYALPSYLSSRYAFTNEYRTDFDENYPREFIWDILKKNGYKTAFISSQDEEWADMISYYNKTNLDFFWHSITDEKWDYGSGLQKNDFDENTTQTAIRWMNTTTEPFFLYINFQATHYPYEYPKNNSRFLPDEPASIFTNYVHIADEDYEASQNRYDNSIYYMDKQIGKIINYLERERQLKDNTIIVLTADHGESLNNSHGFLRHGYGVYEENAHIPLIFYIPGQASFVVEERVRHLDVVPTILNLSGFESSKYFQGKVMEKKQEIFIVTQNQNYVLGVIKGDIKFILDAHTYIWEVYNISEDKQEKNNLVMSKADEIKYFNKYGEILVNWYTCQMDFYKNTRWLDNKLITCP